LCNVSSAASGCEQRRDNYIWVCRQAKDPGFLRGPQFDE
jgi:hypothetical protein